MVKIMKGLLKYFMTISALSSLIVAPLVLSTVKLLLKPKKVLMLVMLVLVLQLALPAADKVSMMMLPLAVMSQVARN